MHRYTENPFRLLGLPPTATGVEIRRRAKALAQGLELGRSIAPAALGHLPPPARVDASALQAAVRELEDPVQRLRHELFWPALERTVGLLRSGDVPGFVAACEAASRVPGAAGALARHDLAVLHHSAAILASAGACPPQAREYAAWGDTFRLWEAVRTDYVYWGWLAGRAEGIGDARLRAADAERLRAALAKDLLAANLALAGKSEDEAWRQMAAVYPAALPRAARLAACDVILEPRRAAFERQRAAIAAKLEDPALDAIAPKDGEGNRDDLDRRKLRAYLQGVEEGIATHLLPAVDRVAGGPAKEMSAGREMLDGAARVLRSLSIDFNNEGGNPRDASRLNARALAYAVTPDLRKRLEEDAGTLLFLDLERQASELAEGERWAECTETLTRAAAVAQTAAQRQRAEEGLTSASTRARWAEQGLRPLKRAPSLRTFNGVGTMLYGRRDYDPGSGSFVATLFFTVLFLPLFPIAAYRVTRASRGTYRFLARARVSRLAKGYAAAVALIVLFLIAAGGAAGPVASGGGGSAAAAEATAAAPASPSAEKTALGAWLNTERSAIDAERSSLRSAEEALSGDKDQIDLARIGLGDDASQADLDDFNAKVGAYNAELEDVRDRRAAFNARVAHFNEEVGRYNQMQ